MRWQVNNKQHNTEVLLPDHIPSDQDFAATVAGRLVTLRWLPLLRCLCVIDAKTGVEAVYKTRSLSLQSFAGEAEVKAQIEFVGGEQHRPHFFAATLQRFVPGQEARTKSEGAAAANIRAPMAGKILKIMIKDGDRVESGQPLLVIEAMKMENKVFAPAAGTIKNIKVKELAQVTPGQTLVVIG